jgi:hypothetical protein
LKSAAPVAGLVLFLVICQGLSPFEFPGSDSWQSEKFRFHTSTLRYEGLLVRGNVQAGLLPQHCGMKMATSTELNDPSSLQGDGIGPFYAVRWLGPNYSADASGE